MRKWIFIGIGIFLISTVVLFYYSNRVVDSQIELTIIQRDEIIQNYKTVAIAESESSFIFFDGSIKEILYQQGDYVKKDEIILKYQNYNEKIEKLKMEQNGYIKQICDNYVEIKNRKFFLEAKVNYGVYSKLKKGMECSVEIDENYYQGKITKMMDFGSKENNETLYRVRIAIDEGLDLLYGQKVIVSLPVKHLSGMTVCNEAIYKDDNGYYVIKSEYREALKNLDSYKIYVDLIYRNDKKSLIEGFGLENKEVCILSQTLQEYLLYD